MVVLEKNTVKSPKKNIVKSPMENTVKSPKENTVKSPRKNTVESPKENTVKSPRKNTVKSPKENTVKSPNKNTVKSPNKNKVKSPNKNTVKSPNKNTVKSPTKKNTVKSPTRKNTVKSQKKNNIKTQNKNKVITKIEEKNIININQELEDIKTLGLCNFNNIKELYDYLKNNKIKNLYNIDNNTFIFNTLYENYPVSFQIIFILNKSSDEHFKYLKEIKIILLNDIYDNINKEILNDNGKKCITSIIKDIDDYDSYKNNINDLYINIIGFGKLKIESKCKKILEIKKGYYCPSYSSYIRSDEYCLGPKEKKGTWIAGLKIQIMRFLGCRFIFLTDAAEVKNHDLFLSRLFQNKDNLSWYSSFGYQYVYDLNLIYKLIKNFNIADIINKNNNINEISSITIEEYSNIFNNMELFYDENITLYKLYYKLILDNNINFNIIDKLKIMFYFEKFNINYQNTIIFDELIFDKLKNILNNINDNNLKLIFKKYIISIFFNILFYYSRIFLFYIF